MNKTLFIGSLKANYGYLIGFTLFTLIYVVVSVAMFQPQSTDIVDAMLTMLPEEMVRAFGFDQLTEDLTTYLAGYLFGFILLVFPMIYSVLIANNLVCKLVDKGSMSYLLTSTNTRVKVIVTQYVYLAASLMMLFVVDYLVAALLARTVFPGSLDYGGYFMLNLLTYSASLLVASIMFLFSCIFNESRMMTMVGAAVGGVFVIARMLSSLSEESEFLKYFTIYSVIDTDKGLNDLGYVALNSGWLIGASLAIGAVALWWFNRKSLTI